MVQRDVTSQPPIGYWLKHADEVITRHVNQVLLDHGFTRFRWQVLNLLYEAGTIARNNVLETMKTFIDAQQLEEILNGFVQEGWLSMRGDGDAAVLELTDAGKAERETIFKLQSEVRRRALRGISDQEYMTVIDVLQRLVNNLE
jgi:DNA-binding MarR family transcriptional regulator